MGNNPPHRSNIHLGIKFKCLISQDECEILCLKLCDYGVTTSRTDELDLKNGPNFIHTLKVTERYEKCLWISYSLKEKPLPTPPSGESGQRYRRPT